jgi:hypothetical protein
VLAVEEGDVVEALGLEVGAELAVDDAQDVAVEGGRDAGGVVVRGLDAARVLDEVDAEQQRAVRPEQAADAAQEPAPGSGPEVADGAASSSPVARTMPSVTSTGT